MANDAREKARASERGQPEVPEFYKIWSLHLQGRACIKPPFPPYQCKVMEQHAGWLHQTSLLTAVFTTLVWPFYELRQTQ